MTDSKTPPIGRPAQRRGQDVYYLRNRPVVVPEGVMAVGHIINAHGQRGEVKVEIHTDFPERFQPGIHLLLGVDLEDVTIEQVRPHKHALLIKFEGIRDRTAAETFRDTWLFVDEENAIELDADEYWIHDLIGLEVVTTDGTLLGTITDVLATGANDVYVAQPVSGINRGREVLIPAIADVVREVDLEAHRMVVCLPDGLIDV